MRLLCVFALTILVMTACGNEAALQEVTTDIPVWHGPPTQPDPDTKGVSYAFTKFFHDTVNSQSTGRWTAENTAGYKGWTLSNTSHSSPKAWLLGGNYWNYENDKLLSNAFTIPADRKDVRLTFRSRWQILLQDAGYVQYSYDGGPWITVASLFDGQNPSYPAWDKYTVALPDTTDEVDAQLRFVFRSDHMDTAWGFGIDDVSVYQRTLEPPENVEASDSEALDTIWVTWDPPIDPVEPDMVRIYRSADGGNDYFFLVELNPDHLGGFYSDFVGDDGEYWYKMTTIKEGYPESDFSPADMGSGL